MSSIDWILSGTTILGESGPGSQGNYVVLQIPKAPDKEHQPVMV